MLAGGIVVTSATTAGAATGANVTWRISSEPDEAKAGYAAMINGIRQGVSAGRVRPEGGGPAVDVTDVAGTDDFIAIDLHAEDRPEFIRLFMRRSDSYVMGWRQGVEDGSGVVNLGRFFTLEADVNLPGAIRTGTGANVNTRFEGLANYNDLQQQGATRDGMQISPASLHNAVLLLQNGDNTASGYVRMAAPAILQMIVAVAEASRFRNQAAETATAFGRGQAFTVTPTHVAQHNNWALMSRVFLTAILGGAVVLSAPLEVGPLVFGTVAAIAQYLMTAHHSSLNTKGRHLTEADFSAYVQPDGFGDYPTAQAAIDAAPSDGIQHVITLAEGTYHETITVPASKSNLFIGGGTGNAADVVITAERAHGMINPATGLPYGTQGSAVATFKAPGITVAQLTIINSFDPANHPEVGPFDTQAVAVAAMGDRQTFSQSRIISRQDTILVKGVTPTTEARQYFVGCYIEGTVDFIFGNATAVFDRCNIAARNWVGGTVLAPNTDKSKKYGILITNSEIFTNGVPEKTMYLGRPWHNSPDVWPQALVRDTNVHSGINSAQPWTDMMPDYSWRSARFREYANFGAGAGVGADAPKMTATEAADYTARKYLAGTDGWDPVF
ncbi:pectinesterase family protein [Streptomyces muensis]|uniref:Pectinesterase n=1 Tax=Streptomyces muensis TaxID=1077944 RepID=A0A9X1TII7_STRM4|nr:pectinesterase family protein [Streptomyces muensis]MCF1592287.1 pectinesterase family protein [Streptomyces muensis]